VTVACPCGRIRQTIRCGRSAASPAGREASTQIRCSNECAVARRNARLAEALGIATDEKRGAAASYADELVALAKANPRFVGVVEKAFSE
jgi:transcriptional repressor NF-X1